jgi:hypothetical protein
VDIGFDELRELASSAGDKRSLAIGMTGLITVLNFHERIRESADLATEFFGLAEAIGDPQLTVGLSFGPLIAKLQAGEFNEAARFSGHVVDLAADDIAAGDLIMGSPICAALLARGTAQAALGVPGWRADVDRALQIARSADAASRILTHCMHYTAGFVTCIVAADNQAMAASAETLQIAEDFDDDFFLAAAKFLWGLALTEADPASTAGKDLLSWARRFSLERQASMVVLHYADIVEARAKMRVGDFDGAIVMSRATIDHLSRTGQRDTDSPPIAVLVESLVRRNGRGDLDDARAAVDRLQTLPTDQGYVMNEVELLHCRALLAKADGDEAGYQRLRDGYLGAAKRYGFAGHVTVAEAMP